MKKLALCAAFAALATGATANERSRLGEDVAANPHQNDAALKTMVDHAVSASRKEGASARPARPYFDTDLRPTR
ncbi:hypothetical protein QYH69_19580 [Paraburkholderia sp. SARCC-3016]|jgi:hypothetical protein|uniref:hypothetical protein n=1 Tax=Paraburkholderia sp. SARCC-3016 TaxID=3058611 RepID=UPI002806C1A9|nr:hypothetical protein [Paraburkholderia sp. SARCC-3016]MDQ7979454.1 hypothetical protein [Paraburkholderia sp. SARCC-3016]